jgi:hypothetical protein
MRIGTAGVWIVFGFLFKVCQLLPRHQAIVATVIGPAWAGPATVVIGSAETVMGLWILSRRWPLACATAQTAAIVAMNTLELIQARELLLSPLGMVCANTVLLILGWILALHTAAEQAA